MKTRTIKIKQSTLFIYKSVKSTTNKMPTATTDTTSTITATTGTTGFNR